MSRILIFLFVHLASCQQQYYAAEQTIQCYDGSLLPAASRCNNVPECAQGEDEYGCPTSQASQSNLVRLPEEHQQKIYVNSYPDYQDYQDYPDYQPQPGKESRPRLLSPNCNGPIVSHVFCCYRDYKRKRPINCGVIIMFCIKIFSC